MSSVLALSSVRLDKVPDVRSVPPASVTLPEMAPDRASVPPETNAVPFAGALSVSVPTPILSMPALFEPAKVTSKPAVSIVPMSSVPRAWKAKPGEHPD